MPIAKIERGEPNSVLIKRVLTIESRNSHQKERSRSGGSEGISMKLSGLGRNRSAKIMISAEGVGGFFVQY